MSAFNPTHDDWYAGLTLEERGEILQRCDARAGADGRDEELVARRLAAWRTQRPFDQPRFFTQRLEAADLDERTFAEILGARLATFRECLANQPVPWLGQIAEVVASLESGPATTLAGGLRDVLMPFVQASVQRVHTTAVALAKRSSLPPFDPAQAAGMLVPDLIERLEQVVTRVFTLELHVARLRGELQGATPEERFGSFIARLLRPEALVELLREYATATRDIAGEMDRSVAAYTEILDRLASDADIVRNQFWNGRDLGMLTAVQRSGLGDSHRGGRAVAILTFSSGLKLVYKPRSIAVDAAFFHLLEWLNGTEVHLGFYVPCTVDRGSYGWMGFVEASACTTSDEVTQFYERLGGLLALLHALDGQDMHMENVIASGPHPVIVDLESLFHPVLDSWLPSAGPPTSGATDDMDTPVSFMARSVMRVGLLPQRIWGTEAGAGVDVSAVGGVADQAAPDQNVVVRDAGTDKMWVDRERGWTAGALNQPRDVADGAGWEDDALALERGFVASYRVLMARKDELTRHGLLRKFADTPVRVVLRPTRTYGLLLRESTHPDFLRDALERDRFFDKLWLGVEGRPALATVIPGEQEALRRGDVPVFTTTPSSRDLVCDGKYVLRDYSRESALDRVSGRIAALSERDLARQRWLVRASMATLYPDLHSARANNAGTMRAADYTPLMPRADELALPVSRTQMVEMAMQIGDHLDTLAIAGGGVTSWLTLTTDSVGQPIAGMARFDLGGGLPGILLFLAQLATVADTDRYDEHARGASALLRELLHDGAGGIDDIGAWSGLGGIAHALALVDRRWPAFGCSRMADDAVNRIAATLDSQSRCDLFGGLAGAVTGLLSHSDTRLSEYSLRVAVACGDRLLELSEQDHRIQRSFPGQFRPCNFEYGLSGRAWALFRLAQASGERRFYHAGVLANQLALSHRRDRLPVDAESTPPTWDSQTGMLLAALAAHFGDPLAGSSVAELRRMAAEGLRAASAAGNHALISGAFGHLDVLLDVDALFPEWGLRDQCRTAAYAVIRSASETGGGWRCGVPMRLDCPGLLNGLAGIGYGLLRLAATDVVPSALTFGYARQSVGKAHRAVAKVRKVQDVPPVSPPAR